MVPQCSGPEESRESTWIGSTLLGLSDRVDTFGPPFELRSFLTQTNNIGMFSASDGNVFSFN